MPNWLEKDYKAVALYKELQATELGVGSGLPQERVHRLVVQCQMAVSPENIDINSIIEIQQVVIRNYVCICICITYVYMYMHAVRAGRDIWKGFKGEK